jgi:AraC family transcriptional regulator
MTAHSGARDWFVPLEPTHFTPDEAERGQKLLELLCSTDTHRELERDGLCRAVCAWLWRSAASALPTQTPPWARPCLEAIESNPHLSVHDLTHIAHFSPAQFRRLWEAQFGQSPRAFLMNKRLEMARLHLESGPADLKAVAQASGFSGAASLSKAFKNRYGVAPLQWRKASRQSG